MFPFHLTKQKVILHLSLYWLHVFIIMDTNMYHKHISSSYHLLMCTLCILCYAKHHLHFLVFLIIINYLYSPKWSLNFVQFYLMRVWGYQGGNSCNETGKWVFERFIIIIKDSPPSGIIRLWQSCLSPLGLLLTKT